MKIDIEKEFNDKVPTASLKFLTGSEAVKQALLETIEHVNAAEAERATTEELRIRNEEIRDAREQGRWRNEDERINNENAREGRENSRRAEEVAREVAESNRVEAERVRSDNEYDRFVAEGGRVSAENGRVTAENLRVSAESGRVNAEKYRATAESSRANEEGTRVSNENTRKDAEATRVNAEKSRVSAEALRINNENARIDAENARAAKDAERDAAIEAVDNRITSAEREIQDVKEGLTTAPEMNGINQYTKTVNLFDRTSGDKVYPITTPDAVLDKDGHNIIQIIEKYWAAGSTESEVMYGVELDVTVADSAVTRIGNMALHRQLPIHNRVKGCLLDDNGKVVKYLNSTTWEGEVRDGSRGQVMVEIPDHYRKFETDGNIRRTKISEYPLPGYHYVPKVYISAYEASMQRSTGKLSSVRNMSADYRGANNSHSAWDTLNKTMLGRPATQMTREEYRNAARERGSTSWNMLDYNAHKTVCWLYLIEYANRNSQLPVMPKDANGFMQGGLGEGVNIGESWYSYSNWWPVIPCGHTDSLGNGSGEVAYDMLNDDGSLFKTVYVPRYRGIENVFGHIWKGVDGENTVLSGSTAHIYVADDPKLYNDSNVDGYMSRGNALIGDSFFRDIIFGEYGEIIPTTGNGASREYWCDYAFTGASDGICTEMFGGNARYGGATAGMFGIRRVTTYAVREDYNGTRLCYIPQNNK